jgi:hypothetical protein
MRVTLYEPALAVGGKAYAGWANRGDELYFPHVDSCCAVMIYGDNAVVGGHMGSQLPSMESPNYAMAGKYVWSLVVANHRRLNTATAGCKVVMVGHPNWYMMQIQYEIWAAVDAGTALTLRTTEKFCSKGADIVATLDGIVVTPCGAHAGFQFGLPDDGEFEGPNDVGA